jgi:hypothetical protein
MNVLTIFRTRNIVKKFAWKILNVSTVYWVGIRQVNCPCTHDVFTMYRAGKPEFIPSGRGVNQTPIDEVEEHVFLLTNGHPRLTPLALMTISHHRLVPEHIIQREVLKNDSTLRLGRRHHLIYDLWGA